MLDMYVWLFFARGRCGWLDCARAEVGLGGLLLEHVEAERARLGDTVGYQEVHADMCFYTETTSSRSAAASPT
jgi:hypothetical protein